LAKCWCGKSCKRNATRKEVQFPIRAFMQKVSVLDFSPLDANH
jgi:hypothetical protein